MAYDDLDAHMARAGSIERAAVPMGMYLAWCANLNLLSGEFQQAHEALMLRLRFREISPSELLITACGGHLSRRDFNEAGQRFSDAYYPGYLTDFRSVFGEAIYDIKDDWAHYDQIAPVLTRHYMENRTGSRRSTGWGRGSLRSPDADSGRKWWKFW